jgi:type VI secretion system secreted protein Hcp
MAVDMFLTIKGVDGESKDGTHTNAIDVLAWSWGMSNSATAHLGSGSGSGKVSVQDLSITKYVDKSSPHLILACCKGNHYPNATLVVRKAGGNPVEYIEIEMTRVFIGSVSTGGSGGEDRLTENIVLNFAEFDFYYSPQKDDGSKGVRIPAEWNIAANTEKGQKS